MLHIIMQMRTHSVLSTEIIDRANIRALHLFESSLILNQEPGTGTSVPENIISSKLIKRAFTVYVANYLKRHLLIRRYTIFDVSLLQPLQGLHNSKQFCHVVKP